ncbi:MAG: sigma-70 family RNA polymerase sigma factor [Planctomycetes bacterium]|nr:sigma-70 family RNA polymerase sigma factor [Planctomycetota bacterium]
MGDPRAEVTRLLAQGEPGAPALLELVYGELHAMARGRMGGERAGHTLQATALVSEAWLRLGSAEAGWRDRSHFFAAASEAMRRILVDHARKVRSQKRGGDLARVTLGAPDAALEVWPDELLALDEALNALEREDPRAAEVTRLRYFVGLSMPEVAQALDVSERTAHREWTFARARLSELLAER